MKTLNAFFEKRVGVNELVGDSQVVRTLSISSSKNRVVYFKISILFLILFNYLNLSFFIDYNFEFIYEGSETYLLVMVRTREQCDSERKSIPIKVISSKCLIIHEELIWNFLPEESLIFFEFQKNHLKC